MNIAAFDLSLSATGCAYQSPFSVSTLRSRERHGMARLQWIRDRVLDYSHAAEVVVLEGYSFGQVRGSSHSHALGELGGVIRLALYERGTPYVDVAPASLKKYATGKGNAAKELVLVEAVKRLGYAGSDNNEADALWLLQMGADAYEQGCIPMPKVNRDALTAVTWPKINIAVPA